MQVPGRDSTDQQDSPSQSAMQTSSYEPNKGHAATDKHPSDLEMVVETESIEVILLWEFVGDSELLGQQIPRSPFGVRLQQQEHMYL